MNTNSIVAKLLGKYPLFGNIISRLNFVYDEKELRAPAYTDGKNVYYTPLINYFEEDEQLFIFAHELLHIVFNHNFRNPKRDHDLLNYVADGIINQLLINDGLKKPNGLVEIPDALDYSVDELYMKYICELDKIKEYMKKFTVHIDFGSDEEIDDNENSGECDPSNSGVLADTKPNQNKFSPSHSRNETDNNDLENQIKNIIEKNKKLRESILDDFVNQIKKTTKAGKMTSSESAKFSDVGNNNSNIDWKDILEASLISQESSKTLYYEVDLDGIIRREKQDEKDISDTEIVIDSSGSVDNMALRAVLSECKNILRNSSLRIRFCDYKAYKWNDITCDSDIDNIYVYGRGGTNFSVMVKSFTEGIDNKIIITDGYDHFPDETEGILWIIIDSYNLPYQTRNIPTHINYIIIKQEDLKNSFARQK